MDKPLPTNCLDCPWHKVIPDPDPHDAFCDDDQAVVCTKTVHNPDYNLNSIYAADRQNHQPITVACRPHYLRDESARPNWCPLV